MFEESPISSYDPTYFEYLARVEQEHFWFCARNRVIAALIEQTVRPLESGYRVLEVGCGTGNVLKVLERACTHGRVFGMDLYSEGLRFAQQNTRTLLVRSNIDAPPFSESFDIIGAFDVLEHLPDDLAGLRQLHRMLKPGGILLLTVPAHKSLWSYFDEAAHHSRRYGVQELRHKLSCIPFEIRYISQFMCSLVPLVWAGRRLAAFRNRLHGAARKKNSDELAKQELRIIPGVNGVLSFVASKEAKLIAGRRVLPCGTSLAAIAVKSND